MLVRLVDLVVAMGCLADRGVTNVLAEGGPHVSAQLAAAVCSTSSA